MIYLSIYLSSSLSFGLSICHLLFLSIYYLSLTFILPSANVYLSISIYLPIDVSRFLFLPAHVPTSAYRLTSFRSSFLHIYLAVFHLKCPLLHRYLYICVCLSIYES